MNALRRRWATLTRDSRDTLFLLTVLGWTLLPQLSRVPAWCAAFAVAALAWRGWLAWGVRALPKRHWLVLSLLVASGATLWSHHTLVGKQPGLTLLVALAALKTLELKARRDAVVVFFLGFFLVMANFLYSQSLALALAMLISVWGLLTALALAHMPAGMPRLWPVGRLALRHAAIGAPLVVVLFLFFPRLPPLWGTPADAGGRTGLSDEMEIGQVAELASDDAIALRVRFDGPPPPQEQLYFRGPVLRLYDGHRWLADDGGIGPRPDKAAPAAPTMNLQLARPLAYEVTVEPLRVRSLPLLEFTVYLPEVSSDLLLAIRDDLVWQAHRPLNERWRIKGLAYLDLRYGPGSENSLRSGDSTLPPGLHSRTQAWAQALKARVAASPQAPQPWIDAVLAHIQTGGYTYTLAPGVAQADPIDSFWLDRREGFCEHFSSAFVLVMRSLGVPARVVTGYQGGTLNPVDGLLEVRQSDAHAWAEVWVPPRGWMRVDPTAAVAPDRIRLNTRLRAPQGLVRGALTQLNPNLVARLQQAWNALDNRWNQWVLNYSRNRQFELLKQLGWEAPDFMALARISLWALGALGLMGALWAAWDARRGNPADPWLRSLQRLLPLLQRRGLAVPAHWPAGRLAQAVRSAWPVQGAELARLLERWQLARYSPHAAAGLSPHRWLQAARAASRKLPKAPPAAAGAEVARIAPVIGE